MDPYEEVAQQGQIHPLLPAYIPNPMELDEHVPVHVLEPEHPGYHAPSDDDIQVEDEDEDPEEDLKEDSNEEHAPEDENTREPSKDSDETEPFEEDETAPPPRHHGARIYAPLGHKTAMIHRRDEILEEDMPPRSRFAFIAPSPGCDMAESSATAARAPRSQYDFVNTVETGQGLIRSPSHDAKTIARAADRAEDVCYVRALQAFEHRMLTSIEETNHRDIRLEIDVVRGQRTAYETELQEVHQAYLSSEAQNRARDIRLEIDVVRGQRTAYETELQEIHQAYLSSEAQNRALLA
nr:hypothetical protein [Tanacetum cinerariifolium]